MVTQPGQIWTLGFPQCYGRLVGPFEIQHLSDTALAALLTVVSGAVISPNGTFLRLMKNIDLHQTRTTILSVDDSPDKSGLMSFLLRQAGYHVVTALDGREGLEIAKLEIPDLIISDVSMPVMGGVELCRFVRADQRLRTVPIMLVTAMQKDTE